MSAMELERAALDRSQAAYGTELETLRASISEHEREKRDLVGVIDRLRSDDEQRSSMRPKSNSVDN